MCVPREILCIERYLQVHLLVLNHKASAMSCYRSIYLIALTGACLPVCEATPIESVHYVVHLRLCHGLYQERYPTQTRRRQTMCCCELWASRRYMCCHHSSMKFKYEHSQVLCVRSLNPDRETLVLWLARDTTFCFLHPPADAKNLSL